MSLVMGQTNLVEWVEQVRERGKSSAREGEQKNASLERRLQGTVDWVSHIFSKEECKRWGDS